MADPLEATQVSLQFDPHSPDLTPDRAYELYAALRSKCPVSRGTNHGGYWSLARYADVLAAARDHRTYSSAGGIYLPPVSEHRFPPIEFDPPEHGKFRQLIAPMTSVAAARAMEPMIRDTVNGFIDAFIERGRADLINELALPLPLHVITELFQLDAEQTEYIRQYSLEFLEHAGDEQGPAIMRRIGSYWIEIFEDRRRHPRDDFVSQLLAINFDLQVSDEMLANLMFILTYAGHDSTALGLGSVLLHLAENVADRQRLMETPSLIPTAIEEVLRVYTPLHWFPRTLTRDVELNGQPMKEGDPVILLYASANRDEEQFDQPDAVKIDRKPNPHLAFGAGIHVCPGMPLARSEIQIAVETLLGRLPDFRLDGTPERTPRLEGGGRHMGVRILPVAFSPRSREPRGS